MTIQCRTGCEQQIYYEEFPFPDGFIYYLPLNPDKIIHNCPNLPKDIVEDPWPNYPELSSDIAGENFWKEYRKYPNNYMSDKNYHDMLDFASYELSSQFFKQDEELSLLRKSLVNTQLTCVLFPSPFMYQYIVNEEYTSGVNWTDLLELSSKYEALKDYKSATTALLLQNQITNDQIDKILELISKEKNIPNDQRKEIFNINISALELRDDYYRKVEDVIKSFIRKKYSKLGDLKSDFPDLYVDANEHRAKTSKHIKHKNDDVIEFLSFGACVRILKYNQRNKKDWKVIDYDIIDKAYFIVNRRNDTDHSTDPTLVSSIPKETKALGFIYSKEIIDFFDNLEYV